MPFSCLLTAFAVVCLILAGAPAPVAAQSKDAGNVMLILDASGSMWGQVEGRTKIEIAREVVGDVLTDIGGKVNMGVITYGHRSKGDCKDIETIVPVGKVDSARYMAAINKLNPKGKTPITAAVRKGAEELRYREAKATIILVSDGLETCAADPCALAEELKKQGIDFKIHVVGFDLKKADTSKLQCLADKTGGRYVSAENAGELNDAIGNVVAQVQEAKPEPAPAPPKPQPVAQPTLLKVAVHLSADTPPLDSAYVHVIPADANKDKRKAVDRGSSSRAYKVPPGKYYLETKYGAAVGSAEATVEDGKTNEAKIVLNAGYLSVKAVEKEGGPPNEAAYVYIYESAQQPDGRRRTVTSGNQRNLFTLPAGKYFATAQIGRARTGANTEIVAGKKTDLTIVLAAGMLKVAALAEEGGQPLQDAYIRIFEAEEQPGGQRRAVTAGNQRQTFTIPAGRYYVTATVGKAVAARTVEVEAAKKTDVSLILGVGALKVTAVPTEGAKPLNSYVQILEAEKALDGSRKRVTGGTTRTTFKLPSGKYHIVVTSGRASVSQDIELASNKLKEITVNLKAGSLSVKADKSFFINVYEAEKNLDGSRQRVTTIRPGRPVVLPAGKYFLEARSKDKRAEAEVEITAGKLKEVELKAN